MFKITKVLVVLAAMTLSLTAVAEGKIAVVNLQEAIMQTDEAQGRLNGLLYQADFSADKADFDKLKKEHEDLVKQLQNDIAVMSAEQQQAARKKLANKQADIEHIGRKLNAAQQELAQTLLQEMAPKVNAVLRDLIQSEGIGLLLQNTVVIHADTSFNITAKVTDKLNQNAAQ